MPIQIQGLCPLLAVWDMPTSIRFYRDVLGFEIVSTSRPERGDDVGWAWLRRDGADLMLNTMYDGMRPAEPDRVRTAAHKDAALFFGCPDVDEAYEHLRVHGFDPEPPFVQSYGMKQCYVRDPDGYNLCFQWPAAEAAAAAG